VYFTGVEKDENVRMLQVRGDLALPRQSAAPGQAVTAMLRSQA
jgi:hypothetical protein